ncbi:MAG: J domain-containing protein [Candidatus Thermoplasmatota archaeon]|nr:J domain-containing protein [Candidatus Thermoplasmatota archaeon]
MPGLDYYHILGVPKECTDKDVKKAYRKLATQYHPDKVCALPPKMREFADEEMRRINRAKETLLDIKMRAEHDKELLSASRGPKPEPAPRPEHQNRAYNFGCPHCSTKVSAIMIDRSYVILCPGCHRQMTIPAKQNNGGKGVDRVDIYREAMRRAMVDGVVTNDENYILDGLREVLNITPLEHQNVLFHLQYKK